MPRPGSLRHLAEALSPQAFPRPPALFPCGLDVAVAQALTFRAAPVRLVFSHLARKLEESLRKALHGLDSFPMLLRNCVTAEKVPWQ